MKRLPSVTSIALAATLLGIQVSEVAAQPPPSEPTPPPAMPMEPAPVAGPVMGDMGGETFGSAGQIALDANLGGLFQWTSSKPPMGDSESGTEIVLQPAMMYFISPNVAIGGLVGLHLQSSGEGITEESATLLRIAPAFGYNIALSPAMSLFPRVFLGYSNTLSLKAANFEGSGYKLDIGLDLPLLFHLAPHLFIGVGPTFSMDLVSSFTVKGAMSQDGFKDTSIGLLAQIGGWF